MAFKAIQIMEGDEIIEDSFGEFDECTHATIDRNGVWKENEFREYFDWLLPIAGDFVCSRKFFSICLMSFCGF